MYSTTYLIRKTTKKYDHLENRLGKDYLRSRAVALLQSGEAENDTGLTPAAYYHICSPRRRFVPRQSDLIRNYHYHCYMNPSHLT